MRRQAWSSQRRTLNTDSFSICACEAAGRKCGPHARGGGPAGRNPSGSAAMWSPRTWGWSGLPGSQAPPVVVVPRPWGWFEQVGEVWKRPRLMAASPTWSSPGSWLRNVRLFPLSARGRSGGWWAHGGHGMWVIMEPSGTLYGPLTCKNKNRADVESLQSTRLKALRLRSQPVNVRPAPMYSAASADIPMPSHPIRCGRLTSTPGTHVGAGAP